MSASVQTEEVLNIAAKLKTKASDFPALIALCKVFAKRERSRNTITVTAMYVNLIKEGRSFSKSKIKEAFKVLHEIGVGKLELDSKDQIIALKDIHVSLPEIGASFSQDRRMPLIPTPPEVKKYTKTPEFQETFKAQIKKKVKIMLSLDVEGEKMQFNTEQDLGVSEVLTLISRIFPGKV